MQRTAGLVFIGSLAAIVVGAGTAAAADQPVGSIHVSAVLASNEGRGFDPELQEQRKILRRLPYKKYQLLRHTSHPLKAGDQYGIDLPGGRHLHMTAIDRGPDYVMLRLILNEHNRPVVSTDVKINDDSILLLGGPKDKKGTLVITIGSVVDRRKMGPPLRSNPSREVVPAARAE